MANYPNAFPEIDIANGGSIGGLTKREYFAAAAMQGMLTIQYVYESVDIKQIAQYAYDQADAMIQEGEE